MAISRRNRGISMNTIINISKAIYPATDFRPAGTAFTSVITRDGFNQELITGLHHDGVLVDEIDTAIKRLTKSMVVNSQTGAVVTVQLPAEYTLSTALKQSFVDRNTIEPEITSVTFA